MKLKSFASTLMRTLASLGACLKSHSRVSPEGASYNSPAHRAGIRGHQIPQALKGRHNLSLVSGRAKWSSFWRPFRACWSGRDEPLGRCPRLLNFAPPGLYRHTLSRLSLALTISLLLISPWNGGSRASAQAFFVISISPANGATNVSTNTNVRATFSLPLVPETVNTSTFQVRQADGTPVAGVATAIGTVATFSPLNPLPANTSFVVRIVGGRGGVRGSLGQVGGSEPLPADFISMFTTGAEGPGQGTPISPGTGGTVTDPRTGAATEIPPNTLKVEAVVNVTTLDSPEQIGQIDNSCDVPIQPDESLPEVPGFVRATEVVRYDIQPCGTNAFGPGTRITLPLRRSLFPRGLSIKKTPPLRLFQLARSGGQLVFLDTGIIAKVTRPGRASGFGDFVTVPNIEVFSTFAAFQPVSSLHQLPPRWHKPVTHLDSLALAQQADNPRLYFPVISQLNGRQTRISIGNSGSASLNATITAYTEAGTLVGTQSRTVGANRQASYLVSDLFPGFTNGAIVIGQGSGEMTGFYQIADNFSAPTMLGGAEGIQTPQPALVFPVIKSLGGGFTDIHVFNPNASPVSLTLAGFTALGSRIDPTDSGGQPLDSITLPSFGTLIIASTGSSSPYDVQLDFTLLDGGSIIVQTTDGQAVTGGEIFGEMINGQPSLAVLNGLPFPSGCLASTPDEGACHVDESPESLVPSAIRQHTLYATHFEDSPAEQMLYLLNVSDSPAEFAVSAFSELGQFRATFPPTGFLTINPHQAFQASVKDLFGFNPAPGYVRVEDPNSALVGSIINRNTVSGRYVTVVPLIPDDPQLTQIATNTFFSRVQLDPPSANPRQTTGLFLFNPNNNSLQFRIRITDSSSGTTRQTPVQSVVARGAFVGVRLSLRALFGNVTINSGFGQVQVTTVLGPGMGGRVIPLAVYRSSDVVSVVPPQDKQP